MFRSLSLAAALAAALCTAATAQDFSKFKFGIQVSPTVSWLNTDDSRIDGDGTNLGLKLAMQGELFFAENYAIATGIGFYFNAGGTLQSQYGGTFFTASELNTPNFPTVLGEQAILKYDIQYVEIPLALKLRTREFGYLTYYLEAPIFTLGIRSKATGTLQGGGQSAVAEEIDIAKEVTPLSLSWGFGGGAEYSISESTRLFGGLQYQNIFTDVTKDKDYTYAGRTRSDDPKATLGAITLKLGVLF